MVGVKTRSYISANTTQVVVPMTTTPINQPTQTTNTSSITRVLTLGTSGTDVTTLQTYLIQKGYLPTNTIKGTFGPQTKKAVQRFQCDKLSICSGTETTTGWGVVGKRTRGVMR
jgi:peptidoglycan hydrolase-like protein with peptidoglycan-binding domain